MVNKLNLVVTGSVAAIKTGQLADALKEQNFDVGYHVTYAAKQFVEAEGKYQIPLKQITEINTKIAHRNADITLVAPASADYISKLANNEVSYTGKLFIAPAMNFMMWQHPATQENIRKLMEQGAKFLGPVLGRMACQDYGYGRFADVHEIAAAVKDDAHRLHKTILPALFKNPCIPTAVKPAFKKILLMVHESSPEAKEAITDLLAKGYEVKVAAAPNVDISGIVAEVCTEHYQLNTSPPGMEHIRMPEWADAVLVYPSNQEYISEMEKGGAASFLGCIYLASKAPVFLVSQSVHTELAHQGVRVLSSYQQFEQEVKMAEQELAGKHFLILGGSPRETVDSFRFYANNHRSEDHGAKVAAELKALGANVTFICPAHSPSKPDGAITTIYGENIISANDMLVAADNLSVKFDGVLQLANISQLKCPNPVDHKISKTSAEAPNLFEVVGNVDVLSDLRLMFCESPIIGYNNFQQRFGVNQTAIADAVITSCIKNEAKPELINLPPKVEFAKRGAATKKIVITTSRTEERLTDDGVIITNAFTGRQGQSLAIAFAEAGWEVVLISGPTNLPDLKHKDIRNVHVTSMSEMLQAAQREIASPVDAYISAAAIADFSVDKPLDIKLLPNNPHTLIMQENASIVGTISKSSNRPSVVVSFAAQSPENILQYATSKFARLGVDLTVANPIGANTAAAKDSNQNQVYFVRSGNLDEVEELSVMSKLEVARKIVLEVEVLLEEKQRHKS